MLIAPSSCSYLRCPAGALLLALMPLLAACTRPYVQPSPGAQTVPHLTTAHATMEDGYRLPLSRWEAEGQTRTVLLALHGLNDYSRAFETLGDALSGHGITVLAYDQRGFGNTVGHGLWHGSERLTADLVTMTSLLRERYPDVPLYLLGESMGGAVVISSLAAGVEVEGIILVAPAVWSRGSMPLYQRAALWLAAHTVPAKRLTGKGLDLMPSDNIEMLRALGRDTLVIKATRVDVLYGISNLMDNAMLVSDAVRGEILVLYGEHDEIIPRQPTCKLVEQLADSAGTHLTTIIYAQGYHMLTRDLQAPVVMHDIADWIGSHVPPGSRGSDLAMFCSQQNEVR